MKKVIRISESELKKIIKKVISESHKDVTCEICGWSWDIEPDDNHPYLCHQCGHEDKNPHD